jgi:hypothetical protein
MTKIKNQELKDVQKGASRMPTDSLFYEKIIPAILIFLAVLLLSIIILAVAVVSGIISF